MVLRSTVRVTGSMVLFGAAKCCFRIFRHSERFVNFAYIPLPGGAAAIMTLARIAYGALWSFGSAGT